MSALPELTFIRFPSKSTILEHLKENSGQDRVDQVTAQVYQAISEVFAHRDLTKNRLEDEIHLITYHFQKDLKLVRDANEMSFRQGLVSALEECGKIAEEKGVDFPRPISQEGFIIDALVHHPLTRPWLCKEEPVFLSAMKVYQVVARLLITPIILGRLEKEELEEFVSLTTEHYKPALGLNEETELQFKTGLITALQEYADENQVRDSILPQERRLQRGIIICDTAEVMNAKSKPRFRRRLPSDVQQDPEFPSFVNDIGVRKKKRSSNQGEELVKKLSRHESS